MSVKSVPITKEGHERLSAELKQLKKVERPNTKKAVAEARAHGDLSENAEYHAARERLAHIESRINYLEDKLARSEIISTSNINTDTITFGCTVKVIDLEDNMEEEYMLVGAEEADPLSGRISTVSPFGKALVGKSKGDIVEVEAPGGKVKLKVIDFSI